MRVIEHLDMAGFTAFINEWRCGRRFTDQAKEITKLGKKRDGCLPRVLRKIAMDWGGHIFLLYTWRPREKCLVERGRGNIPPLEYLLFA